MSILDWKFLNDMTDKELCNMYTCDYCGIDQLLPENLIKVFFEGVPYLFCAECTELPENEQHVEIAEDNDLWEY